MTSSRSLFLSLAVLLGSVGAIGCGSGGGTPPPPPEQQALAPAISPATGTFTSAQSVTIADATAGATIYYTTDGTTPNTSSAVYSKAFTVGTTATVKAIATASGYTNSNTTSATLTINIPMTISLPDALALPMGGTLTLDTSVVTASASCDPSSVTWNVDVNDSNKTTTGGSFASWTADSSNKTWGSISSGNTFSTNSVNTYTVTANCGTASATSQLTVSDPAPTITAVSCSPSESTSACVVPATSSFTSTLTGTNFIGSNQTVISMTNQEWWGTGAHSTISTCPSTMPSVQAAATDWVSFTELLQGTSGTDMGLGVWNYYVYNPPVSTGTGGGWDCLNNAYTVVANSSSSSEAGIVTLEPGSKSRTGTLYMRSKETGQIIWKTNALGLGSTMAATSGDLVYVSNRDAHTVSVINLQTKAIQTISTGNAKPWIGALSPRDGALYLVTQNPGGYNLRRYTDAHGLMTLTSEGPQITDLKSDSEGRLVFLAQHAKETELHRLDPSNGREEIINLELPANQLSLTESGYLLYWTGERHLALIDPLVFRQTAQTVVSNPIFTASAQYIGLSDGTIWEATATSDAIRTQRVGQLAPNEIHSGFVPATSNGQVSFYTVAADERGTLSGPLVVRTTSK